MDNAGSWFLHKWKIGQKWVNADEIIYSRDYMIPRIVLTVESTMFKTDKRNINDSKSLFMTFSIKLQATTVYNLKFLKILKIRHSKIP